MDAQRSALPQTAQLVRVLVLLITVVTLWPVSRPVFAQSGETGADIVEAVNRYRVEQGMPALAVHPALMLAAQRHAEWIAANHQGSHIGEGGSMPDDRAAAAGYPGAARENVASGALNYITAAWAVDSVWATSQGHRLTMLAEAEHIGAGTAWDSRDQYFVLLIGSTSGYGFAVIDAIMTGRQPPPAAATPAPGRSTPTGPLPAVTSIRAPVIPIQIAEPGENGSVVHVVQPGQTAWAIAAVYGVDLNTLLAINGLKRPAILHPGDEIYVRLGPDMMPAPRTVHHVVVEGESAWTIAAIYNVTLDALLEANQLERPVILKPGDILVIPR